MIHICFSLYDKTGNYSKFVGTAMSSVFENISSPPNLPSVTVHILHDNTLTIGNRDKFMYLAGRYNQLVKFYNVEERCAEELEKIKSYFPNVNKTRFSVAMFYRFFIPQLLALEIEKAIYLDADIIVNLNINDLWQIELGDKVLGVVTHKAIGVVGSARQFPLCLNGFVKAEDYFNSGVLLMNLNLLRKDSENLLAAIKFISSDSKYEFPDQDVLNYCYAKNALQLPGKFNKYVFVPRRGRNLPEERIYHYNGNTINSCLTLNMNDAFNTLWMNYYIKTPFFDAAAIGRLWESFMDLRARLKHSAINISAKISGKTRAFFIEPSKIEDMKKTFEIHDDELIIPAKSDDSVKQLIDAMKKAQGKVVFFIMTEKFKDKKFPFNLLTKEGFVERKDFWRGWDLLDSPLNSHSFIITM